MSTRPSRTSWPARDNAVCEATGCRPAGRGPPAAGAAGVSRGEVVAGGVLPASRSAGCGGDRRPDRRGGALPAMGRLEVLRPAAGRRAALEPHASTSRVLCAAAASAASDDPAGAPATDGPARAEPHLGARLQERDALRRSPGAAADRDRCGQSRRPGGGHGALGTESARRAGVGCARGSPRLPGGAADG